jgi:hypothetical protein
MFADDHGSNVHLLDGHGYLGSFRFGTNGAAQYSVRYVETTAKREEHDAGGVSWRFTHRGPFSVLRWGGVPYELTNPTAVAVCTPKGHGVCGTVAEVAPRAEFRSKAKQIRGTETRVQRGEASVGESV